MTDLVIFAGPVYLKKAFKEIQWKRPTKVAVIEGAGSSTFVALAEALRDSSGRILPTVISKYVGGKRSDYDKLCVSSYSAGWGLWNEVFKRDDDRRDIDACVLADSAFGGMLTGHAKFAADAINGKKLMVATTTNNSANWAKGILKTGRKTWTEIQAHAITTSGCHCKPRRISAVHPMPQPSGGLWKTGGGWFDTSGLYWYDYVKPGSPDNQGNDFSHAEHHDLAAPAWQAHVVPYFAGTDPRMYIGLGAAAVGVGAAIWMSMEK